MFRAERADLLFTIQLVHILDWWQPKSRSALVLALLGFKVCICQSASPPFNKQADENNGPEHAVREQGNEGRLALHRTAQINSIQGVWGAVGDPRICICDFNNGKVHML